MKSKIGIVICGLMGEKQFVSDAYIKAVKSAGGLPIILPLVKSNEVIADYVKLCSGFLFCGGGDITPLLFGEEPARGIGETDIALDLFQIRLMKSILKSKKPVLAICRGMQIFKCSLPWYDLSGYRTSKRTFNQPYADKHFAKGYQP